MSKAQRYNKIISFKPLITEEDKTSDFDLSFLTYNGKLTFSALDSFLKIYLIVKIFLWMIVNL